GQQPQLNLRVVSREQNTSGLGNERGANLATQLRANGNILQVWIDGREPARRRSRLVERGMETLGSGIQQQRQRVHVCALELGVLAVVQNQARNFVLRRKLFQHVHRRGDGLALSILHRLGQVQ